MKFNFTRLKRRQRREKQLERRWRFGESVRRVTAWLRRPGAFKIRWARNFEKNTPLPVDPADRLTNWQRNQWARDGYKRDRLEHYANLRRVQG